MVRSLLLSCATAAVLLAGAACSRQPAPSSGGGTAAPGSAVPAAQQGVQTLTGEVVETMDASNYTYMRVRTAGGEVWVATGKVPVKAGETVVVPLEQEMRNWHSATLNRDFPVIYFASRVARQGEPTPPPLAVAHGTASGAAQEAPIKVEPVAPPPGGSTIAEVWANRATLTGKTVTVRGKVVKFNAGIMNRNWIHLQDGSGSAESGTNDITVTTDAVVNVGDVVTVTGTVAVDQNFGFGYAYALLLEKAKLR